MNKNPIKRSASAIHTRQEMEGLVAEIAALENSRRLLAAAMDSQLQSVRQSYEEQMEAQERQLKEKLQQARAWGEANAELFGRARSLELIHGIVGWRTGQPALKTVAGWTWENVKETLKKLGAMAYIRTKDEVNKQYLLAHREVIGAEKLRQIGLRVVQKEFFFVEPKLTEVKCDRAGGRCLSTIG